jgi:type I restriction enzyme M protein
MQVPELKALARNTKSELDAYLKEMNEKKRIEARQLLKERFDYPIFMYEAEKVGISATGEEDQNELYPNTNLPSDCEKTCLEWYREFQADPASLAETEATE